MLIWQWAMLLRFYSRTPNAFGGLIHVSVTENSISCSTFVRGICGLDFHPTLRAFNSLKNIWPRRLGLRMGRSLLPAKDSIFMTTAGIWRRQEREESDVFSILLDKDRRVQIREGTSCWMNS